ncbi:diadenylate cyclase [Oikeobacillus pervagus]|uniref:DNA integrity scanning protein DisA n=1 Tax=Oikeobacillus pervagus TaxID=1325931 RepID=A0AAJ1SZT6_9BACI|nr:DNA integrity scanning diadenylate cyclase DisA [Oikeobacillus pervagus]MDQ0215684.1 diadenylate cyclase [Oikeobacillus pervagus]
MDEKRIKDNTISEILQLVAPGTPIREGIDNVLRANTGGLIVLGHNEKVQHLVDGGFKIDCPFSPTYLYELAKMDGAIILNEKGSKIILANAQLATDPSISSTETGMRHRTAERVAKQTKKLVIAISQRRNVITLYKGDFRYALKDISVILTKANQAIQTLEKYKVVLDHAISNLSVLEFEELVTFSDVLQVLHRFEMVIRIKNELLSYLSELGVEGRLIRLQMHELLTDMEEEAVMIIRDYAKERQVKPYEVLSRFQGIVTNELLDDGVLFKLLGYSGHVHLDEGICPRGYRVLNKIPRLPVIIIENLIIKFNTLPFILKAEVDELDDVDGIGEVRARKIKEGLKLIKDQVFADRQL